MISTILQLKTKNLPSVFVFFYNIKNGAPCSLASKDQPESQVTTLYTLSPLINLTASLNGYIVDEELYLLSKLHIDIPICDFGITILMLYFAKFYSHGQYPLFVYTFRCLKELEIIEKFLLQYNQNNIKLYPNLATHEVYGLRNQAKNFKDCKHITVEAFERIIAFMRSPEITPELFIECIKSLHVYIIESFYMFTSITKNCKVINECHDLMHKNLVYTFQKPTKSLRCDGKYWFTMPSKSVWFAYYQGRLKFSSYISCDIKESMKIFEINKIKCLIVGFIHENQIYPIIFEDPELYSCWEKTINFIRQNNFNCVFRSDVPHQKNNQIYFVKENISTIFKLERQPV